MSKRDPGTTTSSQLLAIPPTVSLVIQARHGFTAHVICLGLPPHTWLTMSCGPSIAHFHVRPTGLL